MSIDFTAIFKTQLDAHIKAITSAVLELEAESADLSADSQLLETLMREFHTIKGAARAIELMEIKDCSHLLEDIYHKLHNGEIQARMPELANITLYAADLIDGMLQARLNKEACISPDVFGEVVKDYLAGNSVILPKPDNQADGQPQAQSPTEAEPELTNSPTQNNSEAATDTAMPSEQPLQAPQQNTLQADAPAKKADTVAPSSDYERLTDTLLNLSGEFSVAIGGVDEQWNKLRRMGASTASLNQSSILLLNSMADKLAGLGVDVPRQRINEVVARMSHMGTEQASISRHLEKTEARLRYLAGELDDEITHARLLPLDTLFNTYPRVIRDLAMELGKECHSDIDGGHIRIDRSMLEAIRAPLMQILRNCLDHGLESTDERKQKGKNAKGKITLQAQQLGSTVRILIGDDGRGIDMQEVKQKVLSRGDTSESLWDAMTLHEQEQFLFLPGFSTVNEVTDISGRGFGLDIVKTELERVGGFIQIDSETGKGCQFQIELPITLSLMNCLLVKGGQDRFFGSQNFCFPLNDIAEVHRPLKQDIRHMEYGLAIRLGEHTLPLHDFGQMMNIASTNLSLESKHLLILEQGENRHALLVDEVLDEMSVVTRSFDERLGQIRDMQAVTLLQNGELALIVDVEDLLTRMNESHDQLGQTSGEEYLESDDQENQGLCILVVEDSVTVREVEKHMLETAGFSVETAVDGVDGLNKVRASKFDLIISDIDMPRMNGIEMIEKIRGIEKFVELPIIVVSYKDREEDRNKAMSSGANHYVTKAAFDSGEMLQMINELISQNKTVEAL